MKQIYWGKNQVIAVRTKRQGSKLCWLLCLSFLMPILLMIPGMVYARIFPFGLQTSMAVDLRNEYVGFYEAFRHALTDSSGFFYSWSKSLGGGMAGTFSYYMLSPLHLLFFLFSRENLPYAILLVQLLKLGLAGLNFAILLVCHEKGRDFRVVLFSTLYGLCSYAVAFMLNHMWLDVILFFPIVVLFLERLLAGKNPIPYVLSLAYLMIVNYYMAYMACLFLAFYAAYALMRTARDRRFSPGQWTKRCLKNYGVFLFYSLIGAGLAAFILAPSFHSIVLSKGSYANEVIPKWKWNYPPQDFFAKIFPGAFSYDEVPYGLPNYFVGTIISFLLVLFFLNRTIRFREKLATLLILLVFYFSMGIDAINLVWHGMQHPLWYIYRYSWLLSFFLVWIGYRSAMRIRFTAPLGLLVTLLFYVLLVVYFLFFPKRFEKFLTPYHLFATLVLVVIMAYLCYQWMKGQSLLLRRQAFLVLCLISFAEMGLHSAFLTGCYSYESLDEFAFYERTVQGALEGLRPNQEEFYRIEMGFRHDNNDAMRFQYPGLSHFNSDLNRTTINVLAGLGFPVTSNSVNGTNPTKLTDGLFALRYYLSAQAENRLAQPGSDHMNNRSLRPDLKEMKKVKSLPWIGVYEIQQPMPLGLLAEKELRHFSFGRSNPIDSQDRIANLIDGTSGNINYFERKPVDKAKLENLRAYRESELITRYNRIEKKKTAYADYRFTTDAGASYYLTVSNTLKPKETKFILNNKKLPNRRTGDVRFSQVYNVASALDERKEQFFRVQLQPDASAFRVNNISLFRFDEAAWKQAVQFQRQMGLQVDHRSETLIAGHFTATAPTPYLLLSIPYDEGWRAELDGAPIATFMALDGLTALEVPEGTHALRLTYQNPYWVPGLITSALSLIVLLFCEMTYLRQGKEKRRYERKGKFHFIKAYRQEEA